MSMERQSDGSIILDSLSEKTTVVSALLCVAEFRVLGRKRNLHLMQEIIDQQQASPSAPIELSLPESRRMKKAIKLVADRPNVLRVLSQHWVDSMPPYIGRLSVQHKWGEAYPSTSIRQTQEFADDYNSAVIAEAQRINDELQQQPK